MRNYQRKLETNRLWRAKNREEYNRRERIRGKKDMRDIKKKNHGK